MSAHERLMKQFPGYDRIVDTCEKHRTAVKDDVLVPASWLLTKASASTLQAEAGKDELFDDADRDSNRAALLHVSLADVLAGRSAKEVDWRPFTATGGTGLPAAQYAALEQFWHRITAESYSGGGKDFALLFLHLDNDSSGTLTFEELRKAVRRTLRITPEQTSDGTLRGFFTLMDSDGGGTVEMAELILFMEEGPAALVRVLKERNLARARGQVLQPDAMTVFHEALVAHAHTVGGKDWMKLFKQLDTDGSGIGHNYIGHNYIGHDYIAGYRRLRLPALRRALHRRARQAACHGAAGAGERDRAVLRCDGRGGGRRDGNPRARPFPTAWPCHRTLSSAAQGRAATPCQERPQVASEPRPKPLCESYKPRAVGTCSKCPSAAAAADAKLVGAGRAAES